MVATGAFSAEDLEAIERRDLCYAAERGAPLALLVVTMLHYNGVDWATESLRRCRRLP